MIKTAVRFLVIIAAIFAFPGLLIAASSLSQNNLIQIKAPSSIVPTYPGYSFGVSGGGTGATTASGARTNLESFAYLTPEDYGAKGDGLRGAVNYSVSGTNVNIEAVDFISATASTTAGDPQVQIIPASAIPAALLGIGNQQNWIDVPNVGTAGGTYNCWIQSFNVATGVFNCNSGVGTVTVTANATRFMKIYGNYPGSGTALNGSYSGGITINGNILRTNDVVFPSGNVQDNDGNLVAITGAGPGGTTLFTTIINQDGTGAEATLATTPSIQMSATTTQKIYWGQFLFNPATDVGKYLELPNAGADGYPATTTQIATVSDPEDATVGQSVSANVLNKYAYLTSGSDDWPGFSAAFTAIAQSQSGSTPIKYLYVPKTSFLANVNQLDWSPMFFGIMCGEGQIYYPQEQSNQGSIYNQTDFRHGVAPCLTNTSNPLPKSDDLVPSQDLKRVQSLAPGSTLTIDFAGNSQFTNGSNGLTDATMAVNEICQQFKTTYSDMNVVCNYRSIGGTYWSQIDPAGPVYSGNTIGGIPPSTTVSGTPWYASSTEQWLGGYIKNDNPDVIIFEFTNVDGRQINFGSMVNSIAYTQTAAWNTANGKNPDIILALDGPQGGVTTTNNFNYQDSSDFASSLQRSFAKAGAYTLALGGKIGLIDFNRQAHIITDGYDPDQPPLMQAYATPNQSANVLQSFPLIPFATTTDYALKMAVNIATTTNDNAAGWWSDMGNEIDFSLGAGAQAQQYNDTGVGGATVGYPGGALRVFGNDASGNLAVEADTYRFTTAAVCSGTAGNIFITCSAAVANQGHNYSNISIPGAGTAGATLSTLIATTSFDGKTINLQTPLVTTVSNKAVTIWRASVPYTVTGIPVTWPGTTYGLCSANAGSNVATYFKVTVVGHTASLTYCTNTGSNGTSTATFNVERMNIPFQPTVTTAAQNYTPRIQLFGPGFVAGGGNSIGTEEEANDNMPNYLPIARVVPDLYGYCGNSFLSTAGTSPFGQYALYGGQCANHRGNLGTQLEDDPIIQKTSYRSGNTVFASTTLAIGGSALTVGQCATGYATTTGVTTNMVATAQPNTYPGDGIVWSAQVSAPNVIRVKVCSTASLTPTSSTYNVRVTP